MQLWYNGVCCKLTLQTLIRYTSWKLGAILSPVQHWINLIVSVISSAFQSIPYSFNWRILSWFLFCIGSTYYTIHRGLTVNVSLQWPQTALQPEKVATTVVPNGRLAGELRVMILLLQWKRRDKNNIKINLKVKDHNDMNADEKSPWQRIHTIQLNDRNFQKAMHHCMWTTVLPSTISRKGGQWTVNDRWERWPTQQLWTNTF